MDTSAPSLIIVKDEKPQPITGKEKEAIRKKGPSIAIWRSKDAKPEEGIVFPEYRPFFSEFITDNLRRIYAVRTKSVLDDSPAIMLDVFSADGYYLYRTRLPFRPVVIKNGLIFEIRRDEEGETTVIKHRVKNWELMKFN